MQPSSSGKEAGEAFAVVLGGCALFLAVLFSVVLLKREGEGLWSVPLIALIFWREYVFTGMRMELGRLRKQSTPAS
jgi:hypothetical protein